jgi:4-hydroxy-2-oxoheptanedioate aldolase
MQGIGKTIIESNVVLDKLRRGEPSVGTWISLASPESAEIQAQVGWDWLLVDVEHSTVGYDGMVNCFRAAQLGGCAPFVRVPWNETIWIQRALDAGAMGVLVPMVGTRGDAEFAVSNTRYAPAGIRSNGGSRLSAYTGRDYSRWVEDNLAVMVQIETAEAVENLAEIVTVPGLDACYIGPLDLMLSLGLTEMGPDTEHENVVLQVLETCRGAGMPCGIWCNTGEEVARRIAQGFQFNNCGSDSGHMSFGARAQFAAIGLDAGPS